MNSLRHSAWNLHAIAAAFEVKAGRAPERSAAWDRASALVDEAAMVLSDEADRAEGVWTAPEDGRQLVVWFGEERV